jgi:hypothetical protein
MHDRDTADGIVAEYVTAMIRLADLPRPGLRDGRGKPK